MTNSLVRLFGPLSAIRDFDHDFDGFFTRQREERALMPACDVVETDSQFEIAIDLPGFSRIHCLASSPCL